MSVLIFGDDQAINVAGYVAAFSGSSVYLATPNRVSLHTVQNDHGLVKIEVAQLGLDDVEQQQFEAAIIVAESGNLRQFIEPLRFSLAGKPMLLAPGGFGGVLRVRRWFEEWSLEPPRLAETTGFPVSGTLVDGVLSSHTVKRSLPLAAATQCETQSLLEIFVLFLPELVASDLQTTSLSNTNHMIHPSVVLLNATRVENGEKFSFYRNGLSPAAGRLIESVDAERIELARRVGAEDLDVREWMIGKLGMETPAMDALLNNLGHLSVGTSLEADSATTALFQDYLTSTYGVGL